MAGTETPTKTRSQISVSPWGIEADHPRNCDLLIQSLNHEKLRSALDGSKTATDRRTGDQVIPHSQGQYMGSMPRLPGMQLHINLEKLTYLIVDPLLDNHDLIVKLQRWLLRMGQPAPERLNGVPERKGSLDVHRMKTLCREMFQLVQSHEARLVRGGVCPDLEDINELPGKYLLNPGAIVNQTAQPRYEDDWSDWVGKITAIG